MNYLNSESIGLQKDQDSRIINQGYKTVNYNKGSPSKVTKNDTKNQNFTGKIMKSPEKKGGQSVLLEDLVGMAPIDM